MIPYRNNPGQGKIALLLSASMVLIFLGLGCMFLLTDTWIDDYPRPTRNYIGYVLVAWAVFRGISVFMKYNRIRREEQDDEQ